MDFEPGDRVAWAYAYGRTVSATFERRLAPSEWETVPHAEIRLDHPLDFQGGLHTRPLVPVHALTLIEKASVYEQLALIVAMEE